MKAVRLVPERSLALRTPIQTGEALDSWLEFLARRNGVTIRRLLPVLGMSTTPLPIAHNLVADTPTPVLRRMERQTGLPVGRLDAASVIIYRAVGWRTLRGSRYCPHCLAETGGHWPIRWRLPWIFGCTRHQLLLADRCPACHRRPRHPLSGRAGLHLPATCPNSISRGMLCGTDLRTAAAAPMPAVGTLHSTQAWIDTQLATIETTDGDARADARNALTDLTDLAALADWFAGSSRESDLADYGPAALQAWRESRGHDRRRNLEPGHHRFSALAGVAAARAHELITAEDHDTIAAHVRGLLHRPHNPTNRGLRLGPRARWASLSRPLQARMLHAVDRQLATLDRLRHRSVTAVPQLAANATADLGRARYVPQLFWIEATIPLLPSHGFDCDALRAALSTCLLLPGRSEPSVSTLAAELHPHRRGLANVTLHGLLELGYPDVLVALCQLAEYLDEHGSPIDYRRRRIMITADLLESDQWQQICRDAIVHPGQHRRYLDARRYLFTLLTGADLNDACHSLAFRNPADRSRHLNFTTTLNTPLRDALHQHATDQLRQLGIDEPLSWHPPTHWHAGLHLPGPNPDDIDLHHVRHLVLDRQLTPGSAARQLDTTIEHVRLALTRIPRPRPRDLAASPAGWQREQRARLTLTKEYFEREYVARGRRLRDLQAETGFTRGTLARYAKQAGIPLIDVTAHKHIDPGWLEYQYLNRRRSFVAIAADLGISEMTVTLASRRYGIPARPPGLSSHPDLIMKLDESIDADIRRAVEGQLHGWQRLRRFQQAMTYPSLKVAADCIGAEQTALISQFHRLERDVGDQLFHRATPTTPMRLTSRGTALLDALRRPDIQALLERHGRPPRGKRRTDEKTATDKSARRAGTALTRPGPRRQVR